MSNDRQVEFLATRSRKRSHIDMSHSHYHRSHPQWPQYGEASSSTLPQQHTLSLPGPQSRYQGHGYDYRRPVMSRPSEMNEVVDLTNEPDSPVQISRRQPSRSHSHHSNRPPHRHRPPRFGRNIMADVVDLEEDEEEEEDEEADGAIDLDPPSSPEVEFVRATERPRPFATSIHLLNVLNSHARAGFLSQNDAFRQEVALRTRHMGRRRPHQPSLEELLFAGNANENVDLTIDLDYQVPGFTIHEPPAPTPPPAYEPPSPAPEGFTRTVTDADVVVCPNCDRELGIGDGLRKQIWVAKPCGHVYCGECTTNRALKKKSAAAFSELRTKPFSKCQVTGCEKSVSQPRNMVQIYL